MLKFKFVTQGHRVLAKMAIFDFKFHFERHRSGIEEKKQKWCERRTASFGFLILNALYILSFEKHIL